MIQNFAEKSNPLLQATGEAVQDNFVTAGLPGLPIRQIE